MTPATSPDDPVLMLADAARLIHCSEATLYRRLQRGDITAGKCGGWRILRSNLLEWVGRGMPAKEEAAPVAVVRAVAGKRGGT